MSNLNPSFSVSPSPSTSSISSQFSTFSNGAKVSKASIRNSSEFRALRQQYFQLQNAHSSLKLAHEREVINSSSQRSELLQKLSLLERELGESKKDQLFMLEAEKAALNQLEAFKSEHETLIASLQSQISQLQATIRAVREKAFQLETELTKAKMATQVKNENEALTEEFVNNLLEEWKSKVITLTNQNRILEEQLEALKSTKIENSSHSMNGEDPEVLRQKILSTYVSLEAAQTVLAQKRGEAERLATRIGNVKILEEKYRDAQIKIRRLESQNQETESVNNNSNIRSSASSPSTSGSDTDLKLAQLTQEMGLLKESLALAQLNQSALEVSLQTAQNSQSALQAELEETQKSIQRLNTTLRVKDSTITSLKEQLDSTVNLLTETLKKKNK